ncbi:hypothetical protein [Metamycoplasma neophronis]|uniref:Uncharacterized protein n=1 Tax=Metamycoplasma neophronis TaxID=872983 RepID=A0ABY2YZL4_9BACT|nr:hypothetical protein [Metamycoplasma neophronis]TPR53696.1 hypothetical protein FJR74_02225 [Metamycoplasma neophronis]
MKFKLKRFLTLGIPLAATATLAPIAAVSCQNINGNVPIPEANKEKYEKVLALTSKISFADLNNEYFPKKLKQWTLNEYYEKYAQKWHFSDPDEFEEAKKIDILDVMNTEGPLFKKLQEKGLLDFFNENFNIKLRTATNSYSILFIVYVMPKYQAEKMANMTQKSEYFDFKFYQYTDFYLDISQFKFINVEEKKPSKAVTVTKWIGYVVPPAILLGVAIYIIVKAIQYKKRNAKLKPKNKNKE